VTLVRSGDVTGFGVYAISEGDDGLSADLTVSSSIVTGFLTSWVRRGDPDWGADEANIRAVFTNAWQTYFSGGSGAIDLGGVTGEPDPEFVDPTSTPASPGLDFRLRPSSPLIDRGAFSAVGTPGGGGLAPAQTYDLGGDPRVRDGDGDGAARVDLGAYEYQGPQIEIVGR
jgi:hypothetical protein